MKRLVPFALLLTAPASAELIGTCQFDRDRLSFAETPLDQARCLLRKVLPLGVKADQPLPPVIVHLMSDAAPPTPAHKAAAIAALPQPYRSFAIDHANDPVSQTEAGLPLLYFVIHDTSSPFLDDAPFPANLDHNRQINDFTPYMNGTFAAEPVAHIFLSRGGQIWAGHDFAEGWRATKLESYVIGPASRGRFVHIEVMQPRRLIDGYDDRGHTYGPTPGFSDAQYRQLAALYVYVSARAGRWLIPAQHATIDDLIPDAHDDPQNFELERFAAELEKLLVA
ncbi:hypothetical protein [Novosphingobium sp.]|uniref:peptidoglycan recognition protein family protein n=1 Tax=Novosphingobium sp. TaxID=1874826 RepID=UPI00286BEDAD|nr:hypothetical protein [Novosphingobium sp.]